MLRVSYAAKLLRAALRAARAECMRGGWPAAARPSAPRPLPDSRATPCLPGFHSCRTRPPLRPREKSSTSSSCRPAPRRCARCAGAEARWPRGGASWAAAWAASGCRYGHRTGDACPPRTVSFQCCCTAQPISVLPLVVHPQVLLGYYRLPESAAQPLEMVVNPQGVEERARVSVWVGGWLTG